MLISFKASFQNYMYNNKASFHYLVRGWSIDISGEEILEIEHTIKRIDVKQSIPCAWVYTSNSKVHSTVICILLE